MSPLEGAPLKIQMENRHGRTVAKESDREQRKRLKAYRRAREEISAAWKARGYGYPPPAFPVLPDDLQGLVCGAKTRAGTPCKRTDIWGNGRCKFHGGLSTGPTSNKGKARSAENGSTPKRKRTP